MTSSMFQGEGGYTSVVGENPKGQLPHPPIQALKQGSIGPTMSDLQFMQSNERKQHEDTYKYEFGHNDGSAPLGTPSF
jgi:hypothetical protein